MPYHRDELFRYHYALDNNRVVVPARYTNANGFALAVIATITFDDDGEMIDWAAYWGGCDQTKREHDCYEWVRKNGNKMSLEDACYFFYELPGCLYRP